MKDFSEADIHDAIEVRGTLEGLAARFAAERGVSPVLMRGARVPGPDPDAALAQAELTDETWSMCRRTRFHALLSEMAGSPLVARQLDKAMALPCVAERLRDGAVGRGRVRAMC